MANATRTNHRQIVEKLKQSPGVWFRVGRYSTPTSAKECVWGIKKGRRAYAPAGAFEAKVGGKDTKAVYARFVGVTVVERPAEEKPKRGRPAKKPATAKVRKGKTEEHAAAVLATLDAAATDTRTPKVNVEIRAADMHRGDLLPSRFGDLVVQGVTPTQANQVRVTFEGNRVVLLPRDAMLHIRRPVL